jgi:excisionase family DNA binding protein
MEKLLLTVAETAELLNIGKNRVYELIYSEQLCSVRFGRVHRIPRSAIERFVEEVSNPDHAA